MSIEMSKKKEWLFLISIFVSCIGCVGTIVFTVVINEVYKVYPTGITDTMISIVNVVIFASSPVIPWMCKKLGSKTTMIIGAVLFTFAGLFTFSFDNVIFIFVMRILTGVGVAICNVVGTILIADAYPNLERRNKVLGWYMIAMGGAGTICGVVCGYLAANNWLNVFLAHLLGIFIIVFSVFFIPGELNKISTTTDMEKQPEKKASKSNVHLGKVFWIFALIMTVTKIFSDINQYYVSVYVEENAIGNTAVLAGYFSSVVQFVGAAIGLIYGWIYKKAKRQTGTLSFLASALSYLLLAVHPSVPLLMLSGVLSGFTLTVMFSYFFAICPSIVPAEKANLSIGILQALLYSVFLIPYLVSFMMKFTGGLFTPICYLVAVVLGILTIIMFILSSKLELSEEA